jgi:hypothetical protein
VYTARELYELTSGRFRILFYIVCGKKKFHDGKKLMPSVITVYFGQTRFLSISQHRPEMPTRVVFCTLRCCRFAPVHMYNKLAKCGAGFAPAGMARMPWLGNVHDICENCWPGAWEPDFLGIFVNDSTQNFILHMLQVNLCGVETQKTIPNMQMVLSILMRSMVASKHVYVLQLSG